MKISTSYMLTDQAAALGSHTLNEILRKMRREIMYSIADAPELAMKAVVLYDWLLEEEYSPAYMATKYTLSVTVELAPPKTDDNAPSSTLKQKLAELIDDEIKYSSPVIPMTEQALNDAKACKAEYEKMMEVLFPKKSPSPQKPVADQKQLFEDLFSKYGLKHKDPNEVTKKLYDDLAKYSKAKPAKIPTVPVDIDHYKRKAWQAEFEGVDSVSWDDGDDSTGLL